MRILAGTIFFALLFALPASAGPISDTRQELNAIYRGVTEHENKLRTVTKQEHDLVSSIARQRIVLQDYRQHMDRIRPELSAVHGELARKQAFLDRIRTEHGELDVLYHQLADQLTQSMISARQAKPSFWVGLAERFSIRSLLSEWAFLDYLVFSHGQAFASAKENYVDVTTEQRFIYDSVKQLTQTKQKLETELTGLEAIIRETNVDIAQQQRALTDTRQQAYTIQRILANEVKKSLDIERVLQAKVATGFPIRRGESLLWPLAVEGRVTSPYGTRVHPIYNEQRFHTGIDIAAPVGTPIYAVAPGIVTVSESLGGYGLTVVIDHGQGLSTFYAHAAELLVGAGERVRKGDTIALVGSTGISTGPHLHFEVREQNTHVDPMIWL